MKYILSFLAGSVSVAAFAPFNYSLLAFLCLAWLFFAVFNAKNNKQAFWHGFVYGMGLFGFGVSWIYISLHTFGNMVPALAVFMVLLLVLLFSFISGLTTWCYTRFLRSSPLVAYSISLPFLWVTSEWIREWILSGFPWMLYGYSQVDNFLAAQATLSGVLGVSFLVCLGAGVINIIISAKAKSKTIMATVALVIVASHFLLSNVDWSKPNGSTKNIQFVQANIAIQDKWNSAKMPAIIADYFRLSKAPTLINGPLDNAVAENVAAEDRANLDQNIAKADITIWPEAAIPMALHQAGAIIEKAQYEQINLLTGIIELDNDIYYNAIAYIPSNGAALDANTDTNSSINNNISTYRKRHLVPFGEYIPFSSILAPLLTSLDIPMSDLQSNKDSSPILSIADINLGLSICYEDAFANEINDALQGSDSEQAHVLINVSEDAWFGDSLAPHQRLQMSQMRAIENARYMVRVSNNGLSAFINDKGDIMALAPQFEQVSMQANIPMLAGTTVFSRFGNQVILLWLLACLGVAIFFKKYSAKR